MYQLLKDNIFQLFFRHLVFLLPTKTASKDSNIGVSMLLCHRDVIMAVYCLQSLFYQLNEVLPVYIVDDGSLTDKDKQLLKKMFTVKIDSRASVLKKIKKEYSSWHNFVKYLNSTTTHVKKFKLGALFLSPYEQTILIEPDILFFNRPIEIDAFRTSEKDYYQVFSPSTYDWLKKKNMHLDFCLRKFFYLKLEIQSDYLFNGGLILVNRRNLKKVLKNIDVLLSIAEKIDYENWLFAEETLLSTLSSKNTSVQLSPKRYRTLYQDFEYTFLRKSEEYSLLTALHITTNVRSLFIFQAVKLVIQTNLFRQKI